MEWELSSINSDRLRVLHLGNEMSWRGGENQVRLLIEGSQAWIEHFVAYPADSRGYERFTNICKTLGLPSKSALDFRNVSKIVKFCRENKIQILDAQSSVGLTWALAVKKRLPQLKVVAHRRVDNPIKKSFFTRRKYQSTQVDVFVAISTAIKKMLIDYGVAANKVFLVRSAVDISIYNSIPRAQARQELVDLVKINNPSPAAIDLHTVWVGNASAMTAQKGHDYLLLACAELTQKKLNFHCVLAGDGPDWENLKRQAQSLGLQPYVTFVGHVKDVPRFLCGLDVLAVPSRNEGLGTILLEGIGAGCALVGSAVGGIPEIVLNDTTGLLVPAGDVPVLGTALHRVIAEPDLRARLTAKAREHVAREFSLQSMIQGNVAAYQHVAGQNVLPK